MKSLCSLDKGFSVYSIGELYTEPKKWLKEFDERNTLEDRDGAVMFPE